VGYFRTSQESGNVNINRDRRPGTGVLPASEAGVDGVFRPANSEPGITSVLRMVCSCTTGLSVPGLCVFTGPPPTHGAGINNINPHPSPTHGEQEGGITTVPHPPTGSRKEGITTVPHPPTGSRREY